MEPVVVSIGGSVLIPDQDDDRYISELAEILNKIGKEVKLYIVVGGGKVARYYIHTARALGTEEHRLDEMGIDVTRLNARLLAMALGEGCNQEIPLDTDTAARMGDVHDIVVMGGTVPGHTTDAVSMELAETIGAVRFINASAVDGVYDKDPRHNEDAVLIPKMTFQELEQITGGEYLGAGKNIVLDPIATAGIVRLKMPTVVVNGRKIEEMHKAILGQECLGTIIAGE